MDEIQKRVEILRKEIEKHNYNYYVLNKPSISDFEFDLLLAELQAIEDKYPILKTSNSPTKKWEAILAKVLFKKGIPTLCYRWPTPIPKKKLKLLLLA